MSHLIQKQPKNKANLGLFPGLRPCVLCTLVFAHLWLPENKANFGLLPEPDRKLVVRLSRPRWDRVAGSGIVHGNILPEDLVLSHVNDEVAVLEVVEAVQGLGPVVELVRHALRIELATIQRVELVVMAPGPGHNRGNRLAINDAGEALIVMYVAGEDEVWNPACSLSRLFDNRLEILAAGVMPVGGIDWVVQ